jgi:hypothetical protein
MASGESEYEVDEVKRSSVIPKMTKSGNEESFQVEFFRCEPSRSLSPVNFLTTGNDFAGVMSSFSISPGFTDNIKNFQQYSIKAVFSTWIFSVWAF